MKINITCYFATQEDLKDYMLTRQIQLKNNIPKLAFTLDDISCDTFCARLILKPGKNYRTSVASSKVGETLIMFTDVETNESSIITYTMFDLGFTNWSVNVYE